MAEPQPRTTVVAEGQPHDSTQSKCTSALIVSCLVLTITTSFVFGWGLGAPNMYNHYTEPFLKGIDPCRAEIDAKAKALEETTTVAAVPVAPVMVNSQDGATEGDSSIVGPKLDEDGNDIEEPEQQSAPVQSSQQKSTFDFVPELIKGIPQSIFLIGAFIGAITGPSWSKFLDRKRTVFANYIFCFASSLCVLLAYYFKQPWLFYLSRLFLGYQGKR